MYSFEIDNDTENSSLQTYFTILSLSLPTPGKNKYF